MCFLFVCSVCVFCFCVFVRLLVCVFAVGVRFLRLVFVAFGCYCLFSVCVVPFVLFYVGVCLCVFCLLYVLLCFSSLYFWFHSHRNNASSNNAKPIANVK